MSFLGCSRKALILCKWNFSVGNGARLDYSFVLEFSYLEVCLPFFLQNSLLFHRQILSILTERLSLIYLLGYVLLSLTFVNTFGNLSEAIIVFCLSCREIKIAWHNRA